MKREEYKMSYIELWYRDTLENIKNSFIMLNSSDYYFLYSSTINTNIYSFKRVDYIEHKHLVNSHWESTWYPLNIRTCYYEVQFSSSILFKVHYYLREASRSII